ncbi:glycosyltransferase family 2 protein [Chryseolinea sp. H1M3-3]|uniref:glycosyltransferase family 2 protein n=1 Tax=Chryseolinea sp. H1M3-3 TaxID=3034144 RepID=UPI0023ECB987|nr:glycosyltransferase family 2 protein [Chryseolinea sp. H1M3-3]
MKTFPKISIITPSFNQGKYLERTILSVVDQNYPNLEYIIIDGGSTDNSVEIIKKYEGRISYWISEKDRGQSHAINKGFQKATGDIVAWINSDDWYEAGVFEEVCRNYAHDSRGIWIGDCIVQYEGRSKSRILRPKKVTFNSMLRYWKSNFCPPQPSIFFSYNCLKKVGFLDEQLHYAMDLDLWLKMARHFNFYYVPKIFSNYLIHNESKSGAGKGFKKFRKEWRMVCFRHLKMTSFSERMFFYWDYYYHHLFKPSSLTE